MRGAIGVLLLAVLGSVGPISGQPAGTAPPQPAPGLTGTVGGTFLMGTIRQVDLDRLLDRRHGRCSFHRLPARCLGFWEGYARRLGSEQRSDAPSRS